MPDEPARKRGGRPLVAPAAARPSGGRNRSPARTWVPFEGQPERLAVVAARLHTSGSALIRRFVEEGLAREEALLGIAPPPSST